MKYMRMQFGKELKEKILSKKEISAIGDWACLIYLEHAEGIELDFKNILLKLSKMEKGPEFAISYEILNKIADDLIADKVFDINSQEYSKQTESTKNKYIQSMFGFELKKRVFQRQSMEKIGRWAFFMYSEYCSQIDNNLLQVMLDLQALEEGPEFAISYEMLNKIVDDLIAGKDVDLNEAEYRETIS